MGDLWPVFAIIAFFVVLCIYGANNANKQHAELEKSCAARGGHLFEQSVHRSTVRLCLSSDGRILE